MATTNHFDLIVLGTDLAGLFTAALAARRGKRVVVLSQGPADGAVKLGGREWRLDDAPLLSLSSPLARRVFEELGLLAQMQRRRRQIPGHFHVALADVRLDVLEPYRSWQDEAQGAFPSTPVAQALATLSESVRRADAAMDELLSSDSVLSPDGFWARRFLNKATSRLRDTAGDPMAPLDDDHPLRTIASAMLPWVQHLKPDLLGQGAALRLVNRCLNTREDHSGGFADLRARLVEVIRQESGEYKPHVRVAELLLKRGKVAGVSLLGKKERYGCEQLVLATDPRRLIDAGFLAGQVPKPMAAALTEIRPFAHRWVLHLVCPNRGLSPAFDGQVVACEHDASAHGGIGNLYLRRRPLRPIRGDERGGRSIVTITRIVGQDEQMEDLRQETLDRLHERGILPFVRDHVLQAYSPHDGLGATDGNDGELDSLGPDSKRRLPMAALFEAPRGSTLGVGLLPLASGIKNLTFASRLTYPGLGLEGEILAGVAAAARVSPIIRPRGGLFARR